jgi:GntR family transcriptional repressor for pyruvate dehydrogenase complex
MPILSTDHRETLTEKRPEPLYAQIVVRIRQWIQNGRLKEGESLPSERELARIFNVSRVPVREALKSLEFLGAVLHVRGKGVFVQRINMGQVLDNVDFLMADPAVALHELFEAREAIECQTARLAAQRRTEKDIVAMEDAIDEMDRNISRGKDVVKASERFHNALVVAAHNVVLKRVNDFIAGLFAYARQQVLTDPRHHRIASRYHKKVLQSVVERDADGAVAIMREHLSHGEHAITKRKKAT